MLFRIFAVSLLLTLLIEVPLSLLWGVRRKGIEIVILVNILTNPVAVCFCLLVRMYLPGSFYLPFQLLAEVIVVIVEGELYDSFLPKGIIGKHPWLMAITLNIVSYTTGLCINAWF